MATDITGLLNQFLGGQVGNLDPSKLTSLLAPIQDLINQSGGLQGLLAKLQAGGLGEQVNSWLGQGTSEPISADQLSDALGEENVDKAAASAGVSPSDLASGLSQILPSLVNKLTPDGELPSVESLGSVLGQVPGASQLQDVLGGILGGASKA